MQEAFASERGPAIIRIEERGQFYESEGKEIEQALLDLDPNDIREEDLELHSNFLPRYATNEGLKWLVPGIVRVALEDSDGEWIIEMLFDELEGRERENEFNLDEAQRKSLLEVHDTFYSVRRNHWERTESDAPFIVRLRESF